jgi:hypothetical protein
MKAISQYFISYCLACVAVFYIVGGVLVLKISADFYALAFVLVAIGLLSGLAWWVVCKKIACNPRSLIILAAAALLTSFALDFFVSPSIERTGNHQAIEFERSRSACRQSNCKFLASNADSNGNESSNVITIRVDAPDSCKFVSIAKMSIANVDKTPLPYDGYRNVSIISRTRLIYWLFGNMYLSRTLFDVASCEYN